MNNLQCQHRMRKKTSHYGCDCFPLLVVCSCCERFPESRPDSYHRMRCGKSARLTPRCGAYRRRMWLELLPEGTPQAKSSPHLSRTREGREFASRGHGGLGSKPPEIVSHRISYSKGTPPGQSTSVVAGQSAHLVGLLCR